MDYTKSVISTTAKTNDCVAHLVMKKVLFSSGLTFSFLSHNTNDSVAVNRLCSFSLLLLSVFA